jgi:hypothetical protein
MGLATKMLRGELLLRAFRSMDACGDGGANIMNELREAWISHFVPIRDISYSPVGFLASFITRTARVIRGLDSSVIFL